MALGVWLKFSLILDRGEFDLASDAWLNFNLGTEPILNLDLGRNLGLEIVWLKVWLDSRMSLGLSVGWSLGLGIVFDFLLGRWNRLGKGFGLTCDMG